MYFVNDNICRSIGQLMQEQQQQNHNSFVSNDSSHKSLKEVENQEYDSSELADPRFSYADPFSR